MLEIIIASSAILVIAAVIIFRKKIKKGSDIKATGRLDKKSLQDISLPKVDPREQKIEDSAEKLRQVLSTLASVMSSANDAADNSSTALGEAKVKISNIKANQYIEEASILLDEIDRVISSNTSLKTELNKSRDELKEQQEKINNLQTAVRIDSLTELANRAALKEQLERHLSLLRRDDNEKFCLMMIDVDHFKKINDTYGHVAGDRILKGLSMKLSANMRSSDFVARYGGEEFSIIIVKADIGSSESIANELRRSIAHSKFALDDTKVKVTISIGVSEAKPDDNIESLVERADKALYRAKREGRNKICIYSPEEDSGKKG